MSVPTRAAFIEGVVELLTPGSDKAGAGPLRSFVGNPDLPEAQAAIQSALAADRDELPLPLAEVVRHAATYRAQAVNLPRISGELQGIPEGGYWQTPLPGDILYSLVPETRPFAKRAKAPQQVEMLEAAARRGQAADLRLLQLYLKKLASKADDEVADTIAKTALPAFGPAILPDLWPTLSAENRTFLAAYRIDIEATLNRLLEKSGKKSTDKSNQVMKAVEMLLEDVFEEGAVVGPASLPMLKLGLKYAPDGVFRRRIAETIVGIGADARESLTDLVDAFERGGISRDHHLIRLLVVIGKDSDEVADALIRAMDDRDSTVRLLSAFNLGQMGEPAMRAMDTLSRVSMADPDSKVRDQAARTLAKLQSRIAPPEVEEEQEELEETV